MFQPTSSLNFRLRLARKEGDSTGCPGNYYIELTGESAFDLSLTLSEEYFCNNAALPFESLEAVSSFSIERATFWNTQLCKNPKLGITGIVELADIWEKFAYKLSRFSSYNN